MKTAFAACCLSVLLYAAQADFKWMQQDAFGGTDIGVHKLELFRKNGPEDIDAARRKRNVLVSRNSTCAFCPCIASSATALHNTCKRYSHCIPAWHQLS